MLSITLLGQPVTKSKRTRQLIIDTATGEPYTITAQREMVMKDTSNGVVIRREDCKQVIRAILPNAGSVVTLLDGHTMTLGALAGSIAAVVDGWAIEDSEPLEP